MTRNPGTITPFFLLQAHEGSLLFVLTTAERRRSKRSRKPIWYTSLLENEDFEDVCVWLGEHKTLWPEWCRIAERDGHKALNEHIDRMRPVDPVEQTQWIAVTRGDDPLEVEITVELVTRTAVIGTHRFDDEAGLARFMEFMTDAGPPPADWSEVVVAELHDRNRSDGVGYGWALIQEACLRPAGALPELIGQVVDGTARRGPTAKAKWDE
ncbi:MAG: hypothetical protein V4472_17505 [Pseudomonadota bacterium]